MYSDSNESERNLLTGAQPVGLGRGGGREGSRDREFDDYNDEDMEEQEFRRGRAGPGPPPPPATAAAAPLPSGGQREMYGLDRWRTGGPSGYASVPGGQPLDAAEEQGGTGYEPYRGAGGGTRY